jgi:hypothetical protein
MADHRVRGHPSRLQLPGIPFRDAAPRRERFPAPVAVAAVVAIASNVVFTLRWGVSGAIVAYGLTQIAVAGGTMVVARWARRQ